MQGLQELILLIKCDRIAESFTFLTLSIVIYLFERTVLKQGCVSLETVTYDGPQIMFQTDKNRA
jgi:hypothetical protein